VGRVLEILRKRLVVVDAGDFELVGQGFRAWRRRVFFGAEQSKKIKGAGGRDGQRRKQGRYGGHQEHGSTFHVTKTPARDSVNHTVAGWLGLYVKLNVRNYSKQFLLVLLK
jgi:hypothetical protein